MGRLISVASGKGGVGKTTVSANLATAIAKLGEKVAVVDADVTMANLALLFGLQSAPITLQDVLMGDAEIFDAMYEGPYGLTVIPSGLGMGGYRKIDPERMKDAMEKLAQNFDYVFVDIPAGIGDNAMAAMAATKEYIIVLTPDKAAIADALKAKLTAEKIGLKALGAIVNMSQGLKEEPTNEEIKNILEMAVLGRVPLDREVRRSFLLKKPAPVVVRAPDCEAAKEFMRIAYRITGIAPKAPEKKGFLTIIKSIFGGKKKR